MFKTDFAYLLYFDPLIINQNIRKRLILFEIDKFLYKLTIDYNIIFPYFCHFLYFSIDMSILDSNSHISHFPLTLHVRANYLKARDKIIEIMIIPNNMWGVPNTYI